MAKKIEKESYEKISGGGRQWGVKEDVHFIRLLQSGQYGTLGDIDFDALATALNQRFHNNRTASACKTRFRTLRKKPKIDIAF